MKKKVQTVWLALGITAMTALPAIAASSNKATADPVTVTTGQAKAEIMVGVESWSGAAYHLGKGPEHPVLHWRL